MCRKLEFPIFATAAVAKFSAAVAAEKMRVASSVQAGHGPLFVAKEKGIFEEDSLDVELVLIKATEMTLTALASNQIDVLATPVHAMPLYLKNTKDYRCVFGLDEALGADGIVVATDIESITYSEGDVKGFPTNAYVKETGLDLGNIDSVNMSANDAAAPSSPSWWTRRQAGSRSCRRGAGNSELSVRHHRLSVRLRQVRPAAGCGRGAGDHLGRRDAG